MSRLASDPEKRASPGWNARARARSTPPRPINIDLSALEIELGVICDRLGGERSVADSLMVPRRGPTRRTSCDSAGPRRAPRRPTSCPHGGRQQRTPGYIRRRSHQRSRSRNR